MDKRLNLHIPPKFKNLKIPAWLWPAVKKAAPFIIITCVIIAAVIAGLYLIEKKTPTSPGDQGTIVEAIKWDEETYFFKATAASWAVSKKAFLDDHPELRFVSASPECSGPEGTQLGTWLYVEPKQGS